MLPGTVADNLAYGLDGRCDDDARDAALAAAGLDAAFLPRTARALSGGERARVALARALTRDPTRSCSTSRPRRSTRRPRA